MKNGFFLSLIPWKSRLSCYLVYKLRMNSQENLHLSCSFLTKHVIPFSALSHDLLDNTKDFNQFNSNKLIILAFVSNEVTSCDVDIDFEYEPLEQFH